MSNALNTLSDRKLPLLEVIEALPNGLIMVDSEGRILLCNAEMENLFGYSKDELCGQALEFLLPSRFRSRHPEYLKEFFQSPKKRAMGAGRELYGLHKSGRELPIEIGLNPVKSEQGIFVLASIVDISKRRAVEDKFRAVVESSPNGLLMVDLQQTIVQVNTQTEKMFGFARQDLLGQKLDVLIPERFHQHHDTYIREYMGRPQSRPMGSGRDLYGRRQDGSEIPIEIGLTPLVVEGQALVLASVVDITERKKIEQAIRQKNLEMEQFVYIVSHDLKSPIVTSLSFIEFIREDLPADTDAGILDSLGRLERANRRMAQLIDDLLRLSRVGRIDLTLQEVDLGDVLREVWADLEATPGQQDVCFDVQEPMPTLTVDRFRMRQLFENLLTNALKYGLANDQPRIEVGAQESANDWQLYVRDNGSGIASEYHKRVFGLFERLETGKEGTGVGLTIVARVAELHGGKAWVESKLGEGATFWVAIPKAIAICQERLS